jgi:translation initiation factor IF-3
LQKGNKVKITIRFKGRQMAHTYIGEEVLQQFIEDVKEYGTAEGKPNIEGKNMSVSIVPVSKKK